MTVIIAPLTLVCQGWNQRGENVVFLTNCIRRGYISIIIAYNRNKCSRRHPRPYERRSGSETRGRCSGRSRGTPGGSPGPSGGVVSTTVPPEGGVGPKKRHLVLYKLAGFRHTEIPPCRGTCTGGKRRKKTHFFRKLAFFAHFWGPDPN